MTIAAEHTAPQRGLLLGANANGVVFPCGELRKWLQVSAHIFRVLKADFAWARGVDHSVVPLFEAAQEGGCPLSLRVHSGLVPHAVPQEVWPLTLDLHAVTTGVGCVALSEWYAYADKYERAVRLTVLPPFPLSLMGNADLALLKRARVVTLALFDPLTAGVRGYCYRPLDRHTAVQMVELAKCLQEEGRDVSIAFLPFCAVSENAWAMLENTAQFFMDRNQYARVPFLFARRALRFSPWQLARILEGMLGAEGSFHAGIDQLVLPWILNKPQYYVRIWALHKLTRHLRPLIRRTRPLPEGVSHSYAQVRQALEWAKHDAVPECSTCRLTRICDHVTQGVREALPGFRARAIPGDVEVNATVFALPKRYQDAVDIAANHASAEQTRLVQEARRILVERPPNLEIPPEKYDIEHHHTQHMPGSIRWFSFSATELTSVPLGKFTPPVTLSATFGGGIAECIGFSFGRYAKVLCGMTAFSHRVTLHIAADGTFVLLRDNEPVRPIEFEDLPRTPLRLSGILEPRLCIWNVDGQIVTQAVQVWLPEQASQTHVTPQFSVLIISTRYARRLQAVLSALAHQVDWDMSRVEVLVAYVPGADATEDVLQSVALAHPEIQLVRMPFSADHMRAKGFMINEVVSLARGEWIILLDSDIVVPPTFFSSIHAHLQNNAFLAPEGRVMLSPQTTARILLGEVRPWECYEALCAEGERRTREALGVPIGFCQIVHRRVFEKVRYTELNHFEGSDWIFGKQVTEHFGTETRLPFHVLHLDHSGSQWYGAVRHL
jgi:hypothetical protein